MATTRIRKEAVWKSFSSHFEELEQLQAQLREIDTRRTGIEQQIETKKRVIECATGLSWEDIQATSVVDASQNGAVRKTARRGAKQTSPCKEGSVRQWVMRAIAHFEDNNPQSRIDEGSIRIYLNAEVPGFLDNHSPNAIYSALNALKFKGLVVTAPGRGTNHHRSQYCLTAQGRAALG